MADLNVKCFVSHLFISSIMSLLVLFGAGAEAIAAQSVDQRIARLERLLENQNLLERYTLLQNLQREVSDLRGEMELLNHNIGVLKKQQKDIYIDVDQRLEQLDQKMLENTSSVVVGGASIPNIDGSDAAQQALSDQEGYQVALGVLKDGRYEDAIESFQDYLVNFPGSDYAANAQYWMAEAYYVIKDYQSAVLHFNKVIEAFSNSRKVPDAYLKLGFSFYELKDWSNSRQALNTVIEKFPAATASKLARRRLDKMRQNGQI